MKSKIKKRVIIGIVIIGIISLILAFNGFKLPLGLTTENVWTASYGHITCTQHTAPDIDYKYYVDSVKLYKCGYETDKCELTIDLDRASGLTSPHGHYQICDVNGNNCGIIHEYNFPGLYQYSPSNRIIFSINSGESAKFNSDPFASQYINRAEITTVELKARTYYILGEENGFAYTQQGCSQTNELKGKTGLEVPNPLPHDVPYNYFVSFTLSDTKTYTYNGQKVLCQTKQLFSVDSKELNDGTTKLIQGQTIKSVECCPQEPNCDPNTFKFTTTPPIRDCDYNSQCANGGNPVAVDGTHYTITTCQDGKCIKSSPTTTECTTSQQCQATRGPNYVCDLSLSGWGKCILAQVGEFCGDGTCSPLQGETLNNCCVDCGNCTHPPVNGECASCDAFVMNQIFGSFWDSKACSTKKVLGIPVQGNTICIFSWLKFALVPIVFLFSLLFGLNLSSSFRKKHIKIIAVISTILLSGLFAYLVFILFWVGLIIAIVGVILMAVIKSFLPTKYLGMLKR